MWHLGRDAAGRGIIVYEDAPVQSGRDAIGVDKVWVAERVAEHASVGARSGRDDCGGSGGLPGRWRDDDSGGSGGPPGRRWRVALAFETVAAGADAAAAAVVVGVALQVDADIAALVVFANALVDVADRVQRALEIAAAAVVRVTAAHVTAFCLPDGFVGR